MPNWIADARIGERTRRVGEEALACPSLPILPCPSVHTAQLLHTILPIRADRAELSTWSHGAATCHAA